MCRQIAFIPTATCAEAPELQIFRVLPGPRKGDVKRTRPPLPGQYLEHHHFYHQLCPRCAEHNWQKRQQTADMRGMVCA